MTDPNPTRPAVKAHFVISDNLTASATEDGHHVELTVDGTPIRLDLDTAGDLIEAVRYIRERIIRPARAAATRARSRAALERLREKSRFPNRESGPAVPVDVVPDRF